MSNIVIGAIKTMISVEDKKFIKKEKDYLYVGKKDKTISVISNGDVLPIFEAFPSLLSNAGHVTIPTQNGNLIIQWGLISVQADSSATGSFPIPFPNTCFQIIGSHRDNDVITGLSINKISASQYTVSVTGGSGGENISWFAIGN